MFLKIEFKYIMINMQKIFFVIFLLVVSSHTFAQVNSPNYFVVKGVFSSGDDYENGKTLYLREMDSSVILDSCRVEGTVFGFSGQTSLLPKPALISSGDYSVSSIIVLEPGTITLSVSQEDKVGGTSGNDKLQSFFEKHKAIVDQLRSLNNTTPQVSEIHSGLMADLKSITYNYLKENMTNEMGEFFITDAARLLDVSQTIGLIKSARPEFQQKEETQLLMQIISSVQPSVGDKFIDVKLKDIDGKDVLISDYVGKNKFILVDFWASWCGPCRMENPVLLEAYKRYKDKGFEIVGISLDDNHYQWAQSIKHLNISWPQISDLAGWNSTAARIYKVDSIPLSFLLNEDGVVIAKNLRGEMLLNELDRLFQ